MSTAIDWPERVEDEVWLMDDRPTLDQLNIFEEFFYEDVSCTEWSQTQAFRHADDSQVPEGLVRYTLRYDGQADRELIYENWRLLKLLAVTPSEIRRRQRTGGPSYQEFRQRQGLARLVGASRRRAAANAPTATQVQAPQHSEFRIQWDETDIWYTPDGSTRIREMDDAYLWHTVIWLVRNVVRLHGLYATVPANVPPALAAATWLRDQPVFRVMLRESIRRNFTFPGDVYNYCKQYVLDRSNTLDGYRPWHDPEMSEQPASLNKLLTIPDVPPERLHHKDLRAIDL